MEKEIEQSFSQVIARGKYVHSIVFHEVKPDKVDEYVKLIGDWYPQVASRPENKVHLVGSWRTEVGDCDTFGKPSDTPPRIHSLTPLQCTSGSTNVTRDTTNHSTPSSLFPVSQISTASLRRSSTRRKARLCKNSRSGPRHLRAS